MSTAVLPIERAFPRSSPRLVPVWVANEWLFWIAFAIWAVLPSSLTPYWPLGGILVKSTDVLLIPLCLLLALPRMIARGARLPRGWHKGMPLWITILCAWGALSTTWSSTDGRTAWGMSYCMAVTAASGLFAYLVISGVDDLRGFLWRLVRALSAISLLYAAQSFLGLGLRSAVAVNTNDFGIDRVRGPLFESSTGFFLLIPALAFALQETLEGRVKRLYGFASAFCLAIAVVGMGSRAGMILLALFVVSSVAAAKGANRLAGLVLVLIIASAAAGIIFTKAKTDRLRSRAKDGRTAMHEAVANILEDRSPGELLLGSGLGSWWPWYLTEIDGGNDLYASHRYLRHTRYGVLIYHPHSTILDLGVELGLVGVLFLFALLAVIADSVRRSLRQDRERIFAAGVAVSLFSIGFDLFLVRRPTRDVVWWVFLFGLLALLGRSQHPLREAQ